MLNNINTLELKVELLKYQNLLLEDLVETKRYLYEEISSEAKMV
jgi:hypothetical protein